MHCRWQFYGSRHFSFTHLAVCYTSTQPAVLSRTTFFYTRASKTPHNKNIPKLLQVTIIAQYSGGFCEFGVHQFIVLCCQFVCTKFFQFRFLHCVCFQPHYPYTISDRPCFILTCTTRDAISSPKNYKFFLSWSWIYFDIVDFVFSPPNF